jgi:hypothetical protein
MQCRERKRGMCRFVAVLLAGGIGWASITTGTAQERREGEAGRRTLSSSTGIEINLTSAKGPLSDEEVAAALEELARRLRGTAKSGGVAVEGEPGPEAPATPAPSTSLPPLTSAPTAASLGPLGTIPPEAEDVLADEGPRLQCFPKTVLFQPPIANPNEPRFFGKATTLHNHNAKLRNGADAIGDVADTGIGGVIPFLRYSRGEERDAWQVDIFALVLSRWSDSRDSIAVDYRFGIPLTRAIGPWEFKIAYEHTSTHLGDEFLEETGQRRISHLRDEIVLGAAYRFLDDFRAYAIFAYAFNMGTDGPDDPFRYDFGLEWSSPCETGWGGRPYAAVDLEIKGDQGYATNFTSQVGWQWRGHAHGPSFRLGLEYFKGRSPYGQFFQDREQWAGVGVFYGF